jgi:hypothetical protein
MTTEELNAIIAKAEVGDITAMKRLTQIYCEVPGFIDYEKAAKWFYTLIQKDSDLNSKTYEKTGYNKLLYGKLKDIVLNAISENEASSFMNTEGQAATDGSLLGRQVVSASPNAKSYIKKAEECLQKKIGKEAYGNEDEEAQKRSRLKSLNKKLAFVLFEIDKAWNGGDYQRANQLRQQFSKEIKEKQRLEKELGVNN